MSAGVLSCIFIAAPVLGIVVVYGGFNIHNAYSFYVGEILNGEEWTNATVPIYLFIAAGILSIIVPVPLTYGIFSGNRRVLILYLALMGMVIGMEITAWVFVSKHDMSGSVRNAMGSSMEKYYNSYQPGPAQFWDKLQTNLNCCGLGGPADWMDAKGAPTVSFVPDSCCLNHFKSAGSCTQRITRNNVKDLDFIGEIIFTKGCLNEFDSDYSIDSLGDWAIAMAIFQLLNILAALGVLFIPSNGYQNLDNDVDYSSGPVSADLPVSVSATVITIN